MHPFKKSVIFSYFYLSGLLLLISLGFNIREERKMPFYDGASYVFPLKVVNTTRNGTVLFESQLVHGDFASCSSPHDCNKAICEVAYKYSYPSVYVAFAGSRAGLQNADMCSWHGRAEANVAGMSLWGAAVAMLFCVGALMYVSEHSISEWWFRGLVAAVFLQYILFVVSLFVQESHPMLLLLDLGLMIFGFVYDLYFVVIMYHFFSEFDYRYSAL